MSRELDHVILTRFNLPSIGVESFIRAQEGWLRGRVALFERFCLPSVRAQTTHDFEWMIYFDPESPEWLMRWIDSQRAGLFRPIFRASVTPADVVDDVRSMISRPRTGLVTSNLDNDDAVAKDFAERLQSIGLPEARTAVYLPQGLIQSGGRIYRRTDRANAFCSVVERWDDPQTCWSDWHNRLGRSMVVRELPGQPGWLQVIHGANVSNRVHGVLTTPARYRSLFPGMLDDLPAPTRSDILLDRVVRVPSRALRDSARSLVKQAVLVLVGKRGLNRAKSALANGRRLRGSL
jgi:hypothetical protein